jgi:NitT/TauT family transport system ATP-binding protein
MSVIRVKDLSFGFGNKPVFKNLSFTLGDPAGAPDNPAVFLGPSGCGKTTLLRLMAGLLVPSDGEMRVEGEAGPAVSFVFQEPRLLPWKTVLANVTLPIEERLGRAKAAERAGHFLALVSLEDKLDALPEELSGGQRQRVNLARAFVCSAPVILMDEPFQSLDLPLRGQLMDLTAALLEESPRTLVAVTHDPREALYLGRRVLVLGKKGGIVFDSPVPETGSCRTGLEGRLLEALIRETE